MKALWKKYSARFDALSRRERSMVALAVLGVLALLTETLLIEPSLSRLKGYRQQMEQQGAEQKTVGAQLVALQSRLADPDSANRVALAQARKDIAAIDARLKGMEKTLVAPDRVAALLEDILKRNRGLKLIALRTLPAMPLVEHKEAKQEKAAKSEKEAPPAGGEAGIFKHGVEITVQGSYGELLAYLSQLEQLPLQMFWSRVNLKVDEYPKTTLSLTVYTLSLDKTWLVV